MSELALEWLLSCRAGIRASCEKLAEHILVRMRVIISLKLCDRPLPEVEDVVQAAMLTFWEKLTEIESDPVRFACRIAKLKIYEFLAGLSRRRKSDSLDEPDTRGGAVEVADPGASTEDDMLKKERVRSIVEVLHLLDAFSQRVIKGQLAGLTTGEIWENEHLLDLTLTRSNFDVKKKRCMEALQALLPSSL